MAACILIFQMCQLTLITRSPVQKSACKDLSRNGQVRAITPEATYTPTSNRASSRSGGCYA
ncbi:alpha-galactosidase [Lacticaseibacillus rhamnosus]|nr:alpha-galactosidase [Lacticaseibacillus rhamnosus]MCT3177164.1 alpha-galactosidase [Lacticaseibacillus rhamnosus]MCT3184187.1 alpha-galactosidase [Lacticaseibacillus rhamnosus]MCT4450225.1 alpha-galactosidase [Lacticaseibacillus rhamnosus]